LGGKRRDDGCGVEGAAGIGGNASERNPVGFSHCHEWPRDAVVLKVGSDNVVALVQHALERHVQGIGAVESEYPAVRRPAVEELVEPMTGIIQHAFRGEGHLVTSPAGIGERVPREAIESGVDALGLRETRGGVIEVDHLWNVYSRGVSLFGRQP
jgi:hypothetical protein